MNIKTQQPAFRQEPRWYVVISNVSSEAKAAAELERAGFDCYFPTWRKEIRHHRTKKWTLKVFPLLMRYGFVRLADPAISGLVDDVDGVHGTLRNQGKPVPVPDDTIMRIRRAQEAGAFDEMRDHMARLRPGATVRIAEGSMIGLQGLVESVKDTRKATILLNLFNGSTPVEIDLEKIAVL